MTENGMSSSSSRPLRLRMRADLVADRQSYQGRDYWVIKDPVSLKYYRFEEEEYALLKMLDGKTSPERIKQKFDQEYSPQKISLQELFQFIGLLYRSSLLVADAAGQGFQLKKRGEENKKRQRVAAMTNVLAMRFKGIDPDRFLAKLNQLFGWFFSIPALVLVMLVAAGALILVTTQWELFQTKLPQFGEFFAAKNWALLAITLAVTKIIHEIGHGLACKRFGGQCHEMGIMFLVLTPCLYCNVSDSWTLPSKWKRASIAAAGMYVEFFLAAIATYVWWFSQPGLLNHLALNVMFVSSVSTVLFNSNPLLRYDGYYILSDLIEIPNLRQKATSILQRTLGKYIFGVKAPVDPFLPVRHKWFFVLYSIAAAAYRWFITFAIFWFLYQVLEPYGLKIIGQFIALFAIYGLVAMPMMQIVRFVKVPGRMSTVKPVNVAIASIVLLAIIIGILSIPLPHYVHCHLYVQPQKSHRVYVDVPGILTNINVEPNSFVETDDVILQVKNDNLLFAIADLESQVEDARIQYKNAVYLAQHEPKKAKEINPARVAYESLRDQLEQKKLELKKLTISAPAGGIVLQPPRVPPAPKDSGEPDVWHGTPLEKRNKGAFLPEGTLVCEIVEAGGKSEAILAIDQTDIEFIRSGQAVEYLIKQHPQQTFHSNIEKISPVEMKNVPRALASRFGGGLVTSQSEQGKEKPVSTTYRVSVPIETDVEVLPGATGVAKIRAGNRTIGQRLLRVACETFRFHL